MKNLSYKKTLTEKIQIKGVLSEDGTKVTVSEKEEVFDITLQDFMSRFLGDYVEITLTNKQEEDLSDELQ